MRWGLATVFVLSVWAAAPADGIAWRCRAVTETAAAAAPAETHSGPLSVTLEPDGSIRFAVMYYPTYPEGSPSCTHTKIVVDGRVYGTMATYREMKPYRVHERLAKKSVKDSFFLFEMKVSDAELAKIKALVESGNAFALLLPGCVQGTCKAVNKGTSFKIPPPFNQVPSLAALYLTLARGVAPWRVTRVRFVGKSKLQSLLSTDVLVDAMVVGWFPFTGYFLKVMLAGDTAYVVPADEEGEEEPAAPTARLGPPPPR